MKIAFHVQSGDTLQQAVMEAITASKSRFPTLSSIAQAICQHMGKEYTRAELGVLSELRDGKVTSIPNIERRAAYHAVLGIPMEVLESTPKNEVGRHSFLLDGETSLLPILEKLKAIANPTMKDLAKELAWLAISRT